MPGPYYTRSKALTEHRAAGVLPFALHEGSVLVLLGAEPCRTGPGGKVWRTMWRDFGGSREAADADSAATAAREFAEETLGLFGACGVDAAAVAAAAAVAEGRLRDPHLALKVVHHLKKGSYHLYLTQQPFISPLMFRLASEQNAATRVVAGAEKSAFAWVPLAPLLAAVASTAPRYFLVTCAHVCGGEGTPLPRKRGGQRRFQLHPCFASSLRQAQRCGLDRLIARAEELPLPPPPPPLAPHVLEAPAAEPAMSVQGAAGAAAAAAGGGSSLAGDSAMAAAAVAAATAAVAAAAVAAAAAAAEAGEEGDLEVQQAAEGLVVEVGCGYWVAQEPIAAALRGSVALDEAAAQLPAGLLLLPDWRRQPQQLLRGQQTAAPASTRQQQQQQQQQQQKEQHAVGAASSPAAAAAAAKQQGATAGFLAPNSPPAASNSSLARPASSLDTASSLRASRQAVAAAAIDDVRRQLEVNSHAPHRHRPSRKQRMKLRRQRQREAEAAAASAAAAAAAAGGSQAGQMERRRHRRRAEAQQQQVQQARQLQPQSEAEMEDAFQPRMRNSKRLRVQVGEA